MSKKIFSFLMFLIMLLLSAKMILREKEPYEYPEIFEPDEKEQNDLHLMVNLKNYITMPNFFSRSFRRPYLNKYNKNIYAQNIDISEYQSQWISQVINNQEDFIINRESKWRYNSIVFDKRNKPLYIARDPNDRFKSDLLLPEIGKFYIPDKIIKIGDQWDLEFKDINPVIVNKDNDKKYYEINMSGKYKLLGYTNYKNMRCAVIESNITVNSFDMFIKSSSQFRKQGGGIIINSEIHNLVYLDYKNEKPFFSKTYVRQIAQGNYLKNYGSTPEEAKQNILKDYEGLINGDETYIMQIFYDYYQNEGGKK